MPSATPDWLDGPYVRVYLSLAVDHPMVWRDPTRLGWWLRCLVAADRYYPAPAPLPPGLPPLTLAELTEAGIVEPVEDEYFRFKGLAGQREIQRTRGRIGGLARAADAQRIAGRFAAGSSAGDRSLVNAGEPRTNGAAVAGANAGDASLVTSKPHQQPATPTSVTTDIQTDDVPSSRRRLSVEEDPPPARAGARGAKPPDDSQCSDPVAHAISHAYYPGVGWRCLACQQEAQINDGESFRAKVERHGGHQF